MSAVVTVAAPTAGDLTERQRRDMLDWLDAQDIPNGSVYRVELDVVDCPLIRVTYLARDEHGRAHLDASGKVAKETAEYAQREQEPSWWQPK